MNKDTIIKISKNGPYVVTNLEEIKDTDGCIGEIEETAVALCRCGESKTKPFCDGTHGVIGFSGDKEEGRMKRKVKDYIGLEIIIHDDRGICSHVGYCTDNLPKVFRANERPWIDPDGESMEKIIETIRTCPSGALSYTIRGIKYDQYFEGDKDIEILENGPYVIKGSIPLEGNDELATLDHYALCRCGHSKNKPLCNGKHWCGKTNEYKKFLSGLNINSADTIGFDNKEDVIQKLAMSGKSENSSMRTLLSFTNFNSILFKGCQLHRMPLNDDVDVNLKTIIGKKAKKPLELSIPFYVSHMSFGAISKEAKIALAKGSTIMDTAMCSGEGGMLPESREAAKIYIYEQGTAAFSYDEDVMRLADAIELKIGQGVKPGVGGHLPKEKITPEIARIRHLKPGEEFISPGRLAGVDDIKDLIERVRRIREITEGKPVGIKFASGHIEEDIEYALKADPDFITIDCRGGATGSTPRFIKDNVGVPAIFAISRARKYLDKIGSEVTLCITGGFRDSSDIAKGLALGADAIALATASLISIGCKQSRICHTGTCPTGIATQDESLRALFNEKKALMQFENFYRGTANELKVFARSNGKDDIHQLDLSDLMTLSKEVSENIDIIHV